MSKTKLTPLERKLLKLLDECAACGEVFDIESLAQRCSAASSIKTT